MTKEEIRLEAHRIRNAARKQFGTEGGDICFISCYNMARLGQKLPWENEVNYILVTTKAERRAANKRESAKAEKLAIEIAKELGLNEKLSILNSSHLKVPVVNTYQLDALGAHMKTPEARRKGFLAQLKWIASL